MVILRMRRVAGARPNHQHIRDLEPTQGGAGTREEPGTLTQGAPARALVPLRLNPLAKLRAGGMAMPPVSPPATPPYKQDRKSPCSKVGNTGCRACSPFSRCRARRLVSNHSVRHLPKFVCCTRCNPARILQLAVCCTLDPIFGSGRPFIAKKIALNSGSGSQFSKFRFQTMSVSVVEHGRVA
jgi:hypothetical protein